MATPSGSAGPSTKAQEAPVSGTGQPDTLRDDIVTALGVAAAEGLLALMYRINYAPLAILLLLHGAIVVGLAMALDRRERSQRDARLLTIALVTTAASGPIGALMSAGLGVFLKRIKSNSALLERWYERISGHLREDPVLDLHERIVSGRTLDPRIAVTTRFHAVFQHGPLEEKQRVLSVIAQKYHPEFTGLLQIALRSPDPPIRVQAAAVMARLRGEELERLKALRAKLSAGAVPEDPLALARQLEASLQSGLLDEQGMGNAREAAKRAITAALERAPADGGARLLQARLLIGEGAYEEARALLQPLIDQGTADAVEPYRVCLLRLRRFGEAGALMVKAA